jgi:hypothetical protein
MKSTITSKRRCIAQALSEARAVPHIEGRIIKNNSLDNQYRKSRMSLHKSLRPSSAQSFSNASLSNTPQVDSFENLPHHIHHILPLHRSLRCSSRSHIPEENIHIIHSGGYNDQQRNEAFRIRTVPQQAPFTQGVVASQVPTGKSRAAR